MSYIGNNLQTAFPSYLNIDDISGSFNGVTTSFALTVGGVAPVPAPASSNQCLISVGGVVQRPDDSGTEGFLLSGSNIVFSSAPTGGDDFFGVILAGADYVNVGVNYPSGTATTPSITFNTDLDTGIYNPGANEIGFTTAGVNRVTIDSSGNVDIVNDLTVDTNTLYVDSTNNQVGIGTSSPSQYLHVNGSSGTILVTGPTNTSGVQLGVREDGQDVQLVSNGSGGALRFYTNPSGGVEERARIDSSGRLLVGTSTSRNASAPLQAYQASGNNWLWVESNSLGNDQFARGIFISGSRSGQVGVYKHSGITNPAGFLYLQREGGLDAWFWTDNGGDLRISNVLTNIGTTGGTVVGTQTSDERIKNILGTVEYGLETVKQLETVRYSLKVRPEVEKLGFIAQQVLPLVPESVFDTNEPIEGEPEGAPTKLGMEYVSLIPVLVNAIKELSAEVDALKAELQTS